MNKKLMKTIGCLALVGAIGVGATLAYLSDSTSTLKNTFVIGNGIDITLTEQDVNDPTKRVEEGNTQEYPELVPGVEYVKDPTTTVMADSNDCYVFMYVEGADEFAKTDVDGNGVADLAIDNWGTSSWIKIDDTGVHPGEIGDGWYVYHKVVEQSETNTNLNPLFTNVVVGQYDKVTNKNVPDISVKSVAVQADGIQTVEEAFKALAGIPEAL